MKKKESLKKIRDFKKLKKFIHTHRRFNNLIFGRNFSFRNIRHFNNWYFGKFFVFRRKISFWKSFQHLQISYESFFQQLIFFRFFYDFFWDFVDFRATSSSIDLLNKSQFLSHLKVFWGGFHIERYFHLIFPS